MLTTQINKKIYIFGPLIFFTIFVSITILIIYSLLNNSLKKNNQWISSKSNLEMSVLGAPEFLKSYQTLADNHLNLSAWFGYNEVITKAPYSLRNVDFDFYLNNNSYLYFIFNKNKELFSAVRLGSSVFPTLNLVVKQDGENISNVPIEIKNISPKKWHHAQFVFENDNKTVILKIDNIEVTNLQSIFSLNQNFGFRGGNDKVLIDNVVAKNIKGNTVFSDNFNYHDNLFLTKYIFILAAICLLEITVFFISLHLKKKDAIKAIYSVLFYIVILLMILLVIMWYMWSFFTTSYPKQKSMLSVWADNPYVHFDYNKIQFEKYQPNNKKKIIFIGTSQTWGAGAEKENETLVNVFGSELAKYASKSADKKNYQIINMAISGSDSTELLHYYKEDWVKLSPRMVIINLSNNDRNGEIFKKNLKEFIKLNKEQGIKTVFTLEANSWENTPVELINHQIMKNIGLDGGVLVLDIHGYIKSKRNTGILWWDSVHPTSYGHQLIGNFIFESVKDML